MLLNVVLKVCSFVSACNAMVGMFQGWCRESSLTERFVFVGVVVALLSSICVELRLPFQKSMSSSLSVIVRLFRAARVAKCSLEHSYRYLRMRGRRSTLPHSKLSATALCVTLGPE